MKLCECCEPAVLACGGLTGMRTRGMYIGICDINAARGAMQRAGLDAACSFTIVEAGFANVL